MRFDGPPGEPPEVPVEVLADHGSRSSRQGFLRLRCRSLRRQFDDGAWSAPFEYDVVERKYLDAVVIVLHRLGSEGCVEVCLRSQLRVPLLFRHEQAVPDPGPTTPVLWELPAGLIEHGEQGVEGIARRASDETHEEAGFAVEWSRFCQLGPACFPTPGLLAEKFHFVHARLGPEDVAVPPMGDGHALEHGARVVFVELEQALQAVDGGALSDVKTELGLRRLAAHLWGGR